MPTSEARIIANQKNAQLSQGPKTAEGKAISRRNALKHVLTGAGIALPVEDADEVERQVQGFEDELKPSGPVSRTLVRRMAVMSVRMDRCVIHETASLTNRIEEAEIAFDDEWPEVEGTPDPMRDQLRREAALRALFDPSKEAILARRYEAAAERCFFKALRELRLVEKQAKLAGTAPSLESSKAALGSFLNLEKMAAAIDSLPGQGPRTSPTVSPKPAQPARSTTPVSSFEVPFAIGKAS